MPPKTVSQLLQEARFALDEARHRYRVARADCEQAFEALRRLDPHFEAECPGCPLCEEGETDAP